jgi:hypothetical protein
MSSWNDATDTVEENSRYLLDWGFRIITGDEEIARAAKRLAAQRT